MLDIKCIMVDYATEHPIIDISIFMIEMQKFSSYMISSYDNKIMKYGNKCEFIQKKEKNVL